VPLMVLFDSAKDHATDPNARCLELGPYLVAAIEGDVLVVFEGSQPVRLAVRGAGGWTIDGLVGLRFPTVRFVPRAAGLQAAPDDETRLHDTEHACG